MRIVNTVSIDFSSSTPPGGVRKYACQIFENNNRLISSAECENQFSSAPAKAASFTVCALRDAANLTEEELIRLGVLPASEVP